MVSGSPDNGAEGARLVEVLAKSPHLVDLGNENVGQVHRLGNDVWSWNYIGHVLEIGKKDGTNRFSSVRFSIDEVAMTLSRTGHTIVDIPPFSDGLDVEKARDLDPRRISQSRLKHNASNLSTSYTIQNQHRGLGRPDTVVDPADDPDGDDNTKGWFGRLCDRIANLNLVLRYAIYVLPLGILFAIGIIVMGTGGRRAHAGVFRLIGVFIWLEVVWVTLWLSNLAVKLLPAVFRSFSNLLKARTRKYSKLLTALEIPLTLIVWSVTAWGSVPIIYYFPFDSTDSRIIQNTASIPWNQPGSPWTETFKRVLLATIPVAGVFLVEKIIVNWVAINYHETQFASKIAEATRWVNLVTELYVTSLTLYPDSCNEFKILDDRIHGDLPDDDDSHGFSHYFRKVVHARADHTDDIFMRYGRRPDSDALVVIGALHDERSTQALAQRIWQSLAQAGAEDLYIEDIVRVLGNRRQKEAEALFLRLDFNRNGAVSLPEMTGMLVDIGHQRTAIQKSVTDVTSAIQSLNGILNVVALVGAALIYAAFFATGFTRNFMAITTAVLSLSFAFASTVQEFAASFVFLFLKHPYDVGDRCEIGDIEVEMVVEEIRLLHTVFRQVTDNRLMQIPNSVSGTLRIRNISRSREMRERIKIEVNARTSTDQLEQLEQELRAFVRTPTSRRDYRPDVNVNIVDIGDFTSLQLVVVYGHKANWSSDSLRLKRRNRFMAEILSALRRVAIQAPGGSAAGSGSREHPQYTVELSVEDAQAAAEKARDEVMKKLRHQSRVSDDHRDPEPEPVAISRLPADNENISAAATAVDYNDSSDHSSVVSRRSGAPDVRGIGVNNTGT